MTDALRLRDVVASRDGRTVWSEGTFAVPKGAIVGVIGPNGSGKTTLLQLLLGTVEPSAGTVEVLGTSPSRGDQRIGYVPQHYVAAVGDAVRSRDLVTLGLRGGAWGVRRSSDDDRRRVDEALGSVGAADVADRRLLEISGGQQQRVALAQAIVHRPELLLLDEPLANLDLRSQHEIVDVLGALHGAHATTMLIVAHDLNPLLSVLTGAIYLLDGHPHYDEIGNVVDEGLLSHLYGTSVRVVRTPQGDLFTRSPGDPSTRSAGDPTTPGEGS